ncbi:NAD-dependent epimerase/dehydratase family protein [Sulfuriferula nivalis]|uniref:dTDP-glucose 4,6-dehydratase n=1 Tax=Sulfuriferula nivalis TaxID=2675298 RepID=A0A809RZ36_9PROT|nr:NAD(P)-dependent oxidoreductase [Sulfuriferula nivalis]BBO99467.1 dTDP-glucose 4,6-dehydratase [Sulfuriferula nivalis]
MSASGYCLQHDLDAVISRTAGSWENFRGVSIFVTGGTGLFGRWLLESLLYANRQLDLRLKITVLTRNEQAFRLKAPHLALDAAVDFVVGDVRDFTFLAQHYDYLIHGATTSADETFRGEEALQKFDTLVTGTRHVLEFAAQCGVKKMLFLSSGCVYGGVGEPVTETYAGAPNTTNPDTALGQAKRAAEFLSACYAQKYGWELVVARCFSFVGPLLPLDIHYAIGNFIGQAVRGESVVVKGDGTPIRSYLYMADLVVWLLTLLSHGRNGEIYNVGSDQSISIRELANLVQGIICPDKPVIVMSEPAYSVGNEVRNVYVPNVTKARNELGLDVWTDLEAAVRLTAASVTGAAACQ